jgi:FtsP/CotA-like multicopper oxidase with cupredoxin domain
VNGQTLNPCPPGILKHLKRQAARKAAAKQRTGVAAQIAGVSPSTATISPLAPVGAGPTALALTNFGPPDYFGVANWMNSPLPTVSAGALTGGMKKFVDGLPGLGSGNANLLGNYIPLAVADTTTFPGSDFYRIGLKEYKQVFHSAFLGTGGSDVRGYFDMGNAADPNPHYLGPIILATRGRATRVLLNNQLTTDLKIPTDTTYMGAGLVSDGTNSLMASLKRATIHLHGGNTPWISDGTPHTWITPAGGDGQPATLGFSKGMSFMNVPDMEANTSVFPTAPTLTDGFATYYYTNQQSGRLLFYHDHAYGLTRLNVFAGEAAGYLIVDPAEESALSTWGVPGTIVTNPTTGAIVAADLGHMIPLVIQDKTFVPDNGGAGTQSAATDPLWDFTNWGGFGNLWFPHVYSPNQNPADLTGANPYGRYDWGPWFFPPQTPASLLLPGYPCTSAAYPGGVGIAFPPLMCPGVPDPSQPAPANTPSSTPEAFLDTPVVNGTAYPNLVVAPAAYRFHVLNAANDRTWNLGLYLAEPVSLSALITAPGNNYSAPVVTIAGCTGGTAIATVGSGVFGGVAFANGIVDITVTSQPTACTAASLTITDATGTGATTSVVTSLNTEVHMVPAIPAMAGRTLPNCAVSSALALNGGGQVTTAITTTRTGLPANCWPQYSSAQGFTAGPFGEKGILSWGNSDARAGGVPDPLTAGPPIIQIGAEGGLLPRVAVIPSTPVSYDYNKRSITVLNVLNHGLMLGGAERADIIVDFSQFAGQTLILYNDAPAPVPGADPRLDYYTNDPDQSSSGGAPMTLAGYGPNIRTIMRIQVTGSNPNTTPLNLAALQAGLPGLFATTQDQVIVPEAVYPAANGNGPNTYVKIQDTSVNYSPSAIASIAVTTGGSGYTSAPAVAITAPASGVTATATATLAPVAVASLALTNSGLGYTSAPAVSITGGGGTGATATVSMTPAGVASVTVSNGGSGYTTPPTVSFTGGGGTGAAGTAVLGGSGVASVAVTAGGTGYTSAPTVTFAGNGTGATATAALNAVSVASLALANGGTGYTSAPGVTFTSGGGTGASATAALNAVPVASLALANGGTGYTSAPSVAFSGGGGSGASATAVLGGGGVASVAVSVAGTGYTSAPSVTFAGTGTGAAGTAVLTRASVASLTLGAGGSGYTSAPTVAITGGGGAGATATARLSVSTVAVTAGGTGYRTAPTVTFTGGGGSGAAATAALAPTAVGSLTVGNRGTGYTSTPTVTISGGGGTGATATATVLLRRVVALRLTSGGSGYTSVPTVTISGGGGTGATATATLRTTSVASITVTAAGSGYTGRPTVGFTGGGGTGARATATMKVGTVTLTAGGTNYSSVPTVGFTGGGSTGATATATLSPVGVASVTVTAAGTGYTSAPTVGFNGGGGSGTVATATLTPKALASLTLTAGGSYTSAPTIAITGGGGTGATATATLGPQSVASLTLNTGGSGYTFAPTVGFTGGGSGTGATATATLAPQSVASIRVTAPGAGYTTAPTVGFTGGGPGTGASATATLTASPVASVTVTAAGSGYTSAPTVGFTGGGGGGALATATLQPMAVSGLTLTSGGSGYSSAPAVAFTGGGAGSGAAATALLAPSSVASVTLTNGGSGYLLVPYVSFAGGAGTGATATATLATANVVPLQPKAIQELFTLDYGRMNATMGVEVPFTNFLTQTTIPYGYIDPPTEIFKDGETQLWKITHNGVDTHFIHFHLFTVQVINRVGWDGAIKPPDPNEVGLKDTVRMNPLEDVIVALRPYKQTLPFAVPSSWRPMDTTKPIGFQSTMYFTNIDPSNNPATVTNTKINFGWEYVWHCHILGHEENDMMRAMILAVAPSVPTASAASLTAGTITLTLSTAASTPNVADPTGFSIYRSTSPTGPFTLVGSVPATLNGTTATGSYTDPGLTSGTTYYYQVVANNLVGYTEVFAIGGYPSTSADSAPSAVVSAIAQ